MSWLIILVLAIGMANYVRLIMRYTKAWNELQDITVDSGYQPKSSVTVVVAARDEEANIEACLIGILAQNYPSELMQVILVNDHSEDGTLENSERISQTDSRLNVIDLVQSTGKKAAITKAINSTDSNLIITTDADCQHPKNWLRSMVHVHESKGAKMVLGPVAYHQKSGLFNSILRLEFLALMGITGGSAQLNDPIMCNGANLAYTRESFNNVNGFSGVDQNASGDDVFLMLKLKEENATSVVFCKNQEAIVSTNAPSSLSEFWQQRKRWISKRTGYNDASVKRNAWISLLGNLMLLVSLIAMFQPHADFVPQKLAFLGFFLLKFLADILLLMPVATFFSSKFGTLTFLISEIWLAIYIPVLAIFGTTGSYYWKNRKVNPNG